METVTLARHAMATRFEVLLHGDDSVRLRAAGEAALDEIERLESQLSLYRPASEISHVNREAALRPVRVSPPVFRLLQQAQRLARETGGAFDITIAPLVRGWGFMRGTGERPEAQGLAEALTCVGADLMVLDEHSLTVEFSRDGVMLDLGAIGKGYAIDRAAEVLLEAGVQSAYLHGGTSSIFAIGAPRDSSDWKTAIHQPAAEVEGETIGGEAAPVPSRGRVLGTVRLRDESLSVSAVWGKCFSNDGRRYGHVIDPRTGQPVSRATLAAVAGPSAAETDALSTALLVLGAQGLDQILGLRPGLRGLVLTSGSPDTPAQVVQRGIDCT